jgi:hypothetical protein
MDNHPREAAMMLQMPMYRHPRLIMVLTGPCIGLISGIVLGLFAVLAYKMLVARRRPPVVAT